MPNYHIQPEDLLFFRDARPMESQSASGGHGGRWPEPSIFFDALHAALHRAFPERKSWEYRHYYGRSSYRPHQKDKWHRFGSLAIAGPFPSIRSPEGSTWLFPYPADVTSTELGILETVHPLREALRTSDLPDPLLYALGSQSLPTKNKPKPWWSKQAFESYLKQDPRTDINFWSKELWDNRELFTQEWTTGIGMSATTGTQDGEHIYSAEYLRLMDGVKLGLHAILPLELRSHDFVERLNELFPANQILISGGQQRACQVIECQHPLHELFPRSEPITGNQVKWVLLTPAIFPHILRKEITDATGQTFWTSEHPGGWLPNWIAPNWIAPSDGYEVRQGDKTVEVEKGRVLLKRCMPRAKQSRNDRRSRIRAADFLDCRLVAACISKPLVLTGWTERLHLLKHERAPNGEELKRGPRATQLAVPAGTVYYFEGKDAPLLADALSWHGSREENPSGDKVFNRRSTLAGEQGFGLGVCGPWEFYEKPTIPSEHH